MKFISFTYYRTKHRNCELHVFATGIELGTNAM